MFAHVQMHVVKNFVWESLNGSRVPVILGALLLCRCFKCPLRRKPSSHDEVWVQAVVLQVVQRSICQRTATYCSLLYEQASGDQRVAARHSRRSWRLKSSGETHSAAPPHESERLVAVQSSSCVHCTAQRGRVLEESTDTCTCELATGWSPSS